jgi:L-methionine (R)-S-oxide reductase
MITTTNSSPHLKELTFPELLQELDSYLIGRWLTDLANSSALLMQHISDINWVGFYLYDASAEKLYLGPFQGLPACTEIQLGRGVCGTALHQEKTLRIANVNEFPGHIACDSRSQSELVVPLILNQKKIGVLDVDSASLNRFTKEHELFFEQVAQKIIQKNIKYLNLY